MEAEMLLALIITAAIWSFFVGLPLLILYFWMKKRFERSLDEERRRFERMLYHREMSLEQKMSKPSDESAVVPPVPKTPSERTAPTPTEVIPCDEPTDFAQKTQDASDFHPSNASFRADLPVPPPYYPKTETSRTVEKNETPQTFQFSDTTETPAPSNAAGFFEKSSETRNFDDSDEIIAPLPTLSVGTSDSAAERVEESFRREGEPRRRSEGTRNFSPPNPERTKHSERPTSLETQVGRKLFGWTAAILFILGGAFFIQLAIQRGWVNPMNRFIGMTLLATAFLALGRRLFRKGRRRFSEMFNSTGIVTFLLTGYYAHFAHLFPPVWGTAILLTTALGGFLLAGLYQSRTIGLVATLGGLAVPFLLPGNGNIANLCVYLGIYYVSVLLLIYFLRRSPLALLGWIGTLLIFWIALGRDLSRSIEQTDFSAAILFLAVFFGLNFVDSCRSVFRRRSLSDSTDLCRALVTPYLFFIGVRALCVENGSRTLFGRSASAFFERYDWLFALALFLLYAAAAVLFSRRENLLLKENLNRLNGDSSEGAASDAASTDDGISAPDRKMSADELNPDRGRFLFSPLSGQVSVARVCAVSFLAAAIPLAISNDFVGTAYLAIAAGLLLAAARGTTDTGSKTLAGAAPEWAETLRSLYAVKKIKTSKWFLCASGFFFLFGTAALFAYRLIPELYPVARFLEKTTLPFFNAGAFPSLLAALLLFGGMIFTTRRVTRSCASGGGSNESRLCPTLMAVANIYGIVGALTFWILATSESFASASVLFFQRGFPDAGIWGAASILFVWLLVAGLIFFLGDRLNSRALLKIGFFVLGFCALKLLFVNLPYYPLFKMDIVDIGPAISPFAFPAGTPAAIVSLRPGPYLTPLLNPVALPYLAAALFMIGIGVLLRTAPKYKVRPFEFRIGLFFGVFGLLFLLGTMSLECWSWFENRAGDWRRVDFYAPRALWLLWLIAAAFLWRLGVWTKSAPIRRFAIVVLFAEIPFVFGGEFCVGDGRTNGEAISSLMNVCAIPAAVLSLYGIFFGVVNGRKNANAILLEEEKKGAAVLGGAWLAILIILLSFEIYRYFSGKTWFGPDDWTRLIGLTFLWSAAAAFFAVIGRRVRILRFFTVALLIALGGKFAFLELFARPAGLTRPVLNGYALGTCLTALATISVSVYLLAGLKRLTSENRFSADGGLGERSLYLILLGAGIVEFWLAASVDLFEAIRLFPAEGGREPIFLAQMSLSILWSVIAGTLLTVGFWKNSAMLRWMAIILFGVTTLKVLTVDLAHVDQLYRVAAFFVLAIALAAGAAAYHFRR